MQQKVQANSCIKQITLNPPINVKDSKPFKLKINLKKIINGKQLKQKVADRLNYFPQCIYLEHQSEKNTLIQDRTQLQSLNIQNGSSFLLLLAKRDYQRPINVQPLIVGGLDLTDIKQLAGYLKKKQYWAHENDRPMNRMPGEEERPMNRILNEEERELSARRRMQNANEQLDLSKKYRRQLDQLKTIFSEKDENELLAILAQTNGDIQRAAAMIFS